MTFQPVNYLLVHMYIPCFVASVTEFLGKRRWNFSAAPSAKTFTNPELLLVRIYIPSLIASVTKFLLKRRRDFAAAPSLPYGIIKMTFCLNP